MSRNSTEGRYGGSRYGRHWRTREHDVPGYPSYWHAMGAKMRRNRRRFKPFKAAIVAMEYQGVKYSMRQIDENTWEPVGWPYAIPLGGKLRIVPAACKQMVLAEQGEKS